MEPLGSVTIHLQFVDEETRERALVLMDQSHSYGDFVRRICWKVLEEDAGLMLVFLAHRYAFDAIERDLLRRISQKYGERHPLIPRWDADESNEPFDMANYVQEALSIDPDPWIQYYLYGHLADRARTDSIGSALEESSLEKMQQLLDMHPELACYEPQLLLKRSEVIRIDGHLEEALAMVDKAMALAIRHDDLALLERLHVRIAYYVRSQDPQTALEHLDQSKRLRQRLGIIPVQDYSVLNIRGIVHNATGEYNAALACFLEAMNQTDVPGTNLGIRFLPANISSVYNRMGRHAEALEYARMAVELRLFITDAGVYKPYSHCHLAMALAGVGRIDEALEHLAVAQELSLKSGSDRMTALCLITSGFIEEAEGDLISAKKSFEDALAIGIPQDQIRTLVDLTRIELGLFTPTEDNCADETSGPWMRRLDKEVATGERPGFIGLSLLLKAELRRKQGRHEEEDELLREVKEIAENPNVHFLQDLLLQLLRVSQNG